MQLLDPPGGKPWALIGLCASSVLLNVVLIARGGPSDARALPTVVAAAEAPTELVASSSQPVASLDGGVASNTGDLAAGQPLETAELAPASLPGELEVLTASVAHSLARTFQTASPEHGDVISAVYSRLFFWDLNVRSDLQQGDRVALAYRWDGELPDIEAAVYDSAKLGHMTAFKFKHEGDDYASWWREDGAEASLRLQQSPIQDYEQVTSLLKDRPTHKGMDFKTPVGTPITTPKAGKVIRVNWNTKYNGDCVEVRYDDGVLARFLHLSATSMKEGQRVSAGQSVGESGNTGRSTAPHLHYELEKNERTIDPVDYHGTVRRQLSREELEAFQLMSKRFAGALNSDA